MHVVATAGHVDHGKSALVRALTGMEPDRWTEERRRGMTIDLGFAWTDLPSGETVAFVDVPGHERFVPNMLAGVGPVPAVLFVVAADDGWMPQSAEHLAALHALDVQHGLLAVTRSDLADPSMATRQALAEIERTSLGHVPAVAVSAFTGTGLTALRAALDRLLGRMPRPDLDAPVRLWVDRSFSIRGSGTVVTGTLGAGRLRVGQQLEVGPGVCRGDALLTPGRFSMSHAIDVRVHGDPVRFLSRTVMFHIGSAAVPARVRPLGEDTARLALDRPLPLRIGDRGLLRDPGRHHVAGGVVLLDVDPPALTRRGAAGTRARVLADLDGRPSMLAELRRRGIVRRGDLERMGITVTAAPVAADWLADETTWALLRSRLAALVGDWTREHPLEPGPPVDVVRRALDLPDRILVPALVSPPLVLRHGRICPERGNATLPPSLDLAVERLLRDCSAAPFAAPAAARLAELGLGPREIAAAVRAGALLRLSNGVVLPSGSLEKAATVLGGLAQPFTVSEARRALATSRRVAVPLLEMLDRHGVTDRLEGDRRRVRAGAWPGSTPGLTARG